MMEQVDLRGYQACFAELEARSVLSCFFHQCEHSEALQEYI